MPKCLSCRPPATVSERIVKYDARSKVDCTKMTDDPIGRLETDDSPAAQPAWNEPPDIRAHGGAPQAEVTCLRDVARAQSKTWTVSARRSFSPPLESRRQAASRAVLSIRKSAAAERGVPAVASQDRKRTSQK